VSQESPPVASYPFVVALTGGIASGKTLISDEFARLGVPVVDTDVIAHAIVEPGQSALMEIAETFGANFINESGKLKRSELRSLIFSDPNARNQ
jgi:dephospho-CoA kinase